MHSLNHLRETHNLDNCRHSMIYHGLVCMKYFFGHLKFFVKILDVHKVSDNGCLFVPDLMKQKNKTFIDSRGVPFIYEKTRSCSLKYYRIKRVERKDTASILWLKGISFPFKVPRPPTAELRWAGILHLGDRPWLLYEYSQEKLADTRRKV